jgi:calcineurin-like phosphoesterase family protein
MLELVIGDVHARPEVLRALLHEVGALDERGRRRRGWWIVQLGDLLDRRAAWDANLATALLARDSVDVVLAGNHEACLLRRGSSSQGAALAVLATHGWPQAVAACGDWLVTHAGVHPELARGLPPAASECAEVINDRWNRCSHGRCEDPLFAAKGPARGGDVPYGGILWMHSDEWPRKGRTPWSQIIGHVPQRKPRLLSGPRWAIDLGGRGSRLAALVRERGVERWQPLVVDAARRDAPGRPARHELVALAA